MLGSRTISVRRKIVFGTAAICTLVVVQQRTVWAVLAVAFLDLGRREPAASWHGPAPAPGRNWCGGARHAGRGPGRRGGNRQRVRPQPGRNHGQEQHVPVAGDRVDRPAAHRPLRRRTGCSVFRSGRATAESSTGRLSHVSPHSFYVATVLRARGDRPGRSRLPVLERVEVSPPGGGRAGYLTADRGAAAGRAAGIFAHLPARLLIAGAVSPASSCGTQLASRSPRPTPRPRPPPAAGGRPVTSIGRVVVVGPASPAALSSHLSGARQPARRGHQGMGGGTPEACQRPRQRPAGARVRSGPRHLDT